MQRTNFDFEILIHDDASTDGTQDIINEYAAKYPGRILPVLQKQNQYSRGVKIDVEYNYSRARGKYIATCEGDDYWCDPDKLQRQVDILERNPGYSMCCHRSDILGTDGQIVSGKTVTGEGEGIEFDFARMKRLGWFFNTLSVVFRKNMLDLEAWHDFSYYRDVHQFYYLLRAGKGYYIESPMAVYRLHDGGVYSSQDSRSRIETDLKVLGELYAKEGDPLLRDSIVVQLRGLGILSIQERSLGRFVSSARQMTPRPTAGMYAEAVYKVAKYYINKKIFGKIT